MHAGKFASIVPMSFQPHSMRIHPIFIPPHMEISRKGSVSEHSPLLGPPQNNAEKKPTPVASKGQAAQGIPIDPKTRPASLPKLSASQLRGFQKLNGGDRRNFIEHARKNFDVNCHIDTNGKLNSKGLALARLDNVGNKLTCAAFHAFSYATVTTMALGIPGMGYILKEAEDLEQKRVEKRRAHQNEPLSGIDAPGRSVSAGEQ